MSEPFIRPCFDMTREIFVKRDLNGDVTLTSHEKTFNTPTKKTAASSFSGAKDVKEFKQTEPKLLTYYFTRQAQAKKIVQ